MNPFPIQINIQFAPLEPFSKRKVTEVDFFFFFDKTDCFTPIPCNPFLLSHDIFFVSSLCNSKKGGHYGKETDASRGARRTVWLVEADTSLTHLTDKFIGIRLT